MSNTFTTNNSTTTQLEKMGLSPMNSSFQLLSDGIAGSKSDIFRFWTHPPRISYVINMWNCSRSSHTYKLVIMTMQRPPCIVHRKEKFATCNIHAPSVPLGSGNIIKGNFGWVVAGRRFRCRATFSDACKLQCCSTTQQTPPLVFRMNGAWPEHVEWRAWCRKWGKTWW